jgi:hypothetical protein
VVEESAGEVVSRVDVPGTGGSVSGDEGLTVGEVLKLVAKVDLLALGNGKGGRLEVVGKGLLELVTSELDGGSERLVVGGEYIRVAVPEGDVTKVVVVKVE